MNMLPETWTSTSILNLSKLFRGVTYSRNDAYNEPSTGLIAVLRANNITETGLKFDNLVYVPRSLVAEEQIIKAGDIVIATSSGSISVVGKAKQSRDNIDASFGAFCALIRPLPGVDPRYFGHFFNTDYYRSSISSLAIGININNLKTSDFEQIQIPLAPLNEQKRIADKLDALLAQVDVCRAHLDRVPDILKQFRQAVLSDATSGRLTEEWRKKRGLQQTEDIQVDINSFDFPDSDCFGSFQFPASWEISRLGKITNITGGITKDTKKQNQNDAEVPYLRVANVQRGFLDLREMKTIRVPLERIQELRLLPGDILFNEGGDLDKLGRGWIWSGEIDPCVFQNHVFRARLRDPRYAPKFFSFYGNSRGYDYFLTYGKQTTNLASINKSLLEALPIVVPTPDEQHEIVRRIEKLFALADRLEVRYQNAIDLVDNLTSTLLSKAFRGELVPQDPNDEPASVLLERIKSERAKQSNQPKSVRKNTAPREARMTEAKLKEIIRKLPSDTFSFDDLRKESPGDYELLKENLFKILSETDAMITQVFDSSVNAIRFVRRTK